MEYRLSREEPVQPSRSARKLKQKRTVKADVLERPASRNTVVERTVSQDAESGSQPDPVGPKSKTEIQDVVPVPQPRLSRQLTTVEMETQEVTADFTDRPETPENDQSAPEPQLEIDNDNYGWRPGSLIPTRVSRAVFG